MVLLQDLPKIDTITFSVENANTLLNEGSELFKKHWKEVDQFTNERPLNIDYATFFQLESQGRLAVFTVRDTGRLVGYAVFTFGVSSHHSIPVASNDAFYIHPQFRRGWTAVKFIKYCLKMLRKTKTKQVSWRTKSRHSFGTILERCGMKEDEVCYSMMLSGENNG